jgi:hypothetical protein
VRYHFATARKWFMPDKREFPTLADRATTLLANLAIFYLAFVAATGQWLLNAFWHSDGNGNVRRTYS